MVDLTLSDDLMGEPTVGMPDIGAFEAVPTSPRSGGEVDILDLPNMNLNVHFRIET